jgi:hypothetical protein
MNLTGISNSGEHTITKTAFLSSLQSWPSWGSSRPSGCLTQGSRRSQNPHPIELLWDDEADITKARPWCWRLAIPPRHMQCQEFPSWFMWLGKIAKLHRTGTRRIAYKIWRNRIGIGRAKSRILFGEFELEPERAKSRIGEFELEPERAKSRRLGEYEMESERAKSRIGFGELESEPDPGKRSPRRSYATIIIIYARFRSARGPSSYETLARERKFPTKFARERKFPTKFARERKFPTKFAR